MVVGVGACGVLRFVLGTGLVWVASGAWIDSPPSIATRFPALKYNQYIGPGKLPTPLERVPLAVHDSASPPVLGSAQCAGYEGKVVHTTRADSPTTMLKEFRMALALQECGALAVLRFQSQVRGVRSYVGIGVFARDANCCRSQGDDIEIPLLVVWEGDMRGARQELEQHNTTVLVSIVEIDDNPWIADLYHHPVFIGFARVLLPALDLCVAAFALRALAVHLPFCTRRHAQHKSVFQAMRPHIVLSLVLVVTGCLLRAAYCLGGPFFSNGNFTLLESHVLINISQPIQLPVIFVVTCVFRRITSMQGIFPPQCGWVVAVAVLCLAVATMEIVGSVHRGLGMTFARYAIVSYSVAALVVVVSTCVFLLQGVPFLAKVRSLERGTARVSPGSLRADRAKQIQTRFAASIIWGTAGLILQFAMLLLAMVSNSVVFTPTGFGTALILYYFGVTIAAFFHVLAFSPALTMRRMPSRLRRSLVHRRRSRGATVLADLG